MRLAGHIAALDAFARTRPAAEARCLSRMAVALDQERNADYALGAREYLDIAAGGPVADAIRESLPPEGRSAALTPAATAVARAALAARSSQ